MKQYRALVEHILDTGLIRGDRTGTGTKSVFGYQMRFDLNEHFPLLETKKTNFKAIKAELDWFLSGSTNVFKLDSKIWDEWAGEGGSIGPMYGEQWRSWGSNDIDQIDAVIHAIKTTPESRRLLVSAWNVDDLPDESMSPRDNVKEGRMALAPCHVMFQFYVADGKLSCQLYQRSADVFLGLPFNIASYALLTHMIANECGLGVGEFIHTLGDAHIYMNHTDQVQELLARIESPNNCRLKIDGNNISIANYNPQPHIKAKVAI